MRIHKMMTLAAAVAATVAAMSSASAAEITLRFANVTNQPSKDAAQVLMDVVSKESGGRIEIKHFPDNMLGDDRTVVESTLMGDIDMVQTVPSVLASMVPDLYVWDAPFMFDNIEDAWKCMDGKLLRLPSKKPQHHGCIQSKCHGLFSVPAGDAFTNGRHVVRQIRIDLDTSKP